MYASVRNKGRSIGYIIEKYIGKTGKKMFMLFCILVFATLIIILGICVVIEGFKKLFVKQNDTKATD